MMSAFNQMQLGVRHRHHVPVFNCHERTCRFVTRFVGSP